MPFTRQDAEKYLAAPRVRAFLRTISRSEGAGYNTLVFGGVFSDYTKHPNIRRTRNINGKAVTSSAAGAYQMIYATWMMAATALGLTDFSAHSQDLAAVWLLNKCGALQLIMLGTLEDAIHKASIEWASLPGSHAGQHLQKMTFLKQFYAGQLAILLNKQ